MLHQHTSLATNSSLQIHSAFLSKTGSVQLAVNAPSARTLFWGPAPFSHALRVRALGMHYVSIYHVTSEKRCVSFLDLAALNFVRDHNPVPFFPTFTGSSTKF